MTDEIKVIVGEDGMVDIYDDTYDVIIHCESEEEQNETVEKLKKTANPWIPVTEKLPEDGEKVLVWHEYFRYGDYNCMYQTYGIGYQYEGHWSGDVYGTKAKCIAWMPLPKPYRESEEQDKKHSSKMPEAVIDFIRRRFMTRQ